MRLINKSEQEFEAELNQRDEALKIKERELQKREGDLELKQKILDDAQERATKESVRLQKEREDICASHKKLEERREELSRREIEAKTGFAKMQQETFKEVVESRFAELNALQQKLDDLAERVKKDMKDLTEREKEIAHRDESVTKREYQADAEFPKKVQALADEAKRQRDENIREENRLKQREEQLIKEQRELAEKEVALRLREKQVLDDEMKRDAGYSAERAKFDAELKAKRDNLEKTLAEREGLMLADMEKEISAEREKRRADIRAIVEGDRVRMVAEAESEARRIRDRIAEERKSWEEERAQKEGQLRAEKEANEKKRGEIEAFKAELEGKQQELRLTEQRLERERSEQESRVEDRVAAYKDSLEKENADYKQRIESLSESLSTQRRLLGALEDLKRKLGDEDPAKAIRDLNAKTDEIRRLQEELASRPSVEMRERYEKLEHELEESKALEAELRQQIKSPSETDFADLRHSKEVLEFEKEELKSQIKTFTQKVERLEAAANEAHAAANEAQAELLRLRKAYECPSEVAARYREIEMPYITSDKFSAPEKAEGVNELEWLKGIDKRFKEHGFVFPPRITKAFHTSLKTAEWSPITVLAGVSGTGKSKLPELYSRFGGFVFDLLDVQPNWDSQESMLGFFNSIDNKFDAQSVLKLLAQSQMPNNESYEDRLGRWRKMAGAALELDSEKDARLIASLRASSTPGLADCVSIVLLDEMNLAHPELYFAGFLSKLEERSGKHKEEVPELEVKVGAGLPAYKLRLGRNVLWVGTMNQDETTKSLSDKVLDRATVIYFPRPKMLRGMEKIKVLGSSEDRPVRTPLHKDTFSSWVVHDCSAISKLIGPYKEFVEKINDALGSVGRAIGHRVWQSIQYYMANYPDVRDAIARGGDENALKKAMHVAFEDQLVQKVMPKLRGIDIRGEAQTKCLEKIRLLLSSGVNGAQFGLLEDFKLAQTLGYGQFMWQSANYIDENEEWPTLDEGEGSTSANEQQ